MSLPTWSPAELSAIDTADRFGVSPLREDGVTCAADYHRP
jgi:hypothetical protein